jgi:hypothetical protein
LSGRRIVLLCAVALALFSALYSLAAWYDWWPRLPPGALHDTDLWAGFAGGVALLLVLLLNPPLRHERHDEGSRNRVVGEGVCGGRTRRMSRPSAAVAAGDARCAPPAPTSVTNRGGGAPGPPPPPPRAST